ncbi:hypothetical protein S7W_19473 [Mycobacteroides abscessus M94]|nr:hypothetical protein S7W_19473 [Mycobacteroides abscessus M94]
MTTVLLAAGLLTSCWTSAAKTLDYAVDGRLTTYNVNSVAGNASAGAQAFNRVLTGFGFHGPDGQVIADHDFGTVEVVGRIPLVLDYTINEKAVYSDGKPVTCEDMVLSWFAQSGRMPDFDTASTAGYADISTVDCKPGQKTARVTFAPDRAFTDWTQLFTATTMLPWHVVADKLGGNIDLVGAIASNNVPALQKIADFWNNQWNLDTDLDLSKFPSSGPYKLDGYNDDGSVVLVANDKWWGNPPVTKRVTVWPSGIDVQKRLSDGDLEVVDVAAGSAGTLTAPDGFVRTEEPGSGVEQLIFGAGGSCRSTRSAPCGRVVHAAGCHRGNRRSAGDERTARHQHRRLLRLGGGCRRSGPVHALRSDSGTGGRRQPSVDSAGGISGAESPSRGDRVRDGAGLRARGYHGAGCQFARNRTAFAPGQPG